MQPVVAAQTFGFPPVVDYKDLYLPDGDINQISTARQTYLLNTSTRQAEGSFSSYLENTGQHADTLELSSSGNFLGNTGQSSAQQYNDFDTTGAA